MADTNYDKFEARRGLGFKNRTHDEVRAGGRPKFMNEKGLPTLPIPGAEAGNKLVADTAKAFDEGGVTSAIGKFARGGLSAMGTAAKEAFVDPINRFVAPINNLKSSAINAAADIGKTALTGDVAPTGQKPVVLPTTGEAQANTRLPIPPNMRADRQGFDDPTLDSIPFRVGGNAPIMKSTAANIVTPQPMAGIVPMQQPGSGWIRNESTGETVSVAGDGPLRMMNAAGQPIAAMSNRIGLPTAQPSQGMGVGMQRLSDPAAQGQAMQRRFQNAVSQGEYSPEAQAARGMQQRQFLGRQGFEEVNKATGMTASQMNTLKPKRRVEVIKAAMELQGKQGANEIAEGNLANQVRITDAQVAGAGLDQEGKRMTIEEQKRVQGLQKAYNEAKTPEEKASAEKALIASGAMKRDKPEVFFDEERDQMGNVIRKTPYILENGAVRPAVGGAGLGGKAMNFGDPSDTTAVEHLRNLRKTNPKEYERLKSEWSSQK